MLQHHVVLLCMRLLLHGLCLRMICASHAPALHVLVFVAHYTELEQTKRAGYNLVKSRQASLRETIYFKRDFRVTCLRVPAAILMAPPDCRPI